MIRNKLIAIMGSSFSGKTTTAINLAKELSNYKDNILIVFSDSTTAHIPYLYQKEYADASIGNLISNPIMNEKLLLENIVVNDKNKHILSLGFKLGDNIFSYPIYNSDIVEDMIIFLKSYFDFIICDLSSDVNSLLSSTIIKMADKIFHVSSKTLKSQVYNESIKYLYDEKEIITITTLHKILDIAKEQQKKIDYELETVLDAAIELKNGNQEIHDLIIFYAAHRLKLRECDAIVLAQITMANSSKLVESLGLLTLSSPVEGVKQLLEEMEEKRQIDLYNRYEKQGCSCC